MLVDSAVESRGRTMQIDHPEVVGCCVYSGYMVLVSGGMHLGFKSGLQNLGS